MRFGLIIKTGSNSRGSPRSETEMSASARQLPVADSVGDDSWQFGLGLGFKAGGFVVGGFSLALKLKGHMLLLGCWPTVGFAGKHYLKNEGAWQLGHY